MESLISLNPDRLTSKIFLWDLGYCDLTGSWSNYILGVMNDIYSSDCFYQITECDISAALCNLQTIEANTWDTNRYTKPKLRYYNMYKACRTQEEYLNFNIPKYSRSLFAQFRAGILPLQVEIGRYRDTDLSVRNCTLCSQGVVEDEFHLLCKCDFYDEFRSSLYRKAAVNYDNFINIDDLEQFVYLVNNEQRAVITFLTDAIQKRRSSLYN